MMIKVKRPFGYYDTALGIIGRTGENDTRTIDFDCTTALTEYPNANIICVCLRPGDDEPYTIPLSTDSDHRVLTLSSADLEKEGRLTLELRMVDGDKVLKSARFTGTVASSLQGEGDAPGTPVRDTLDRLDAEIKAAQAVVDDIRAKLDAGEFDGPQGPKGDPGSDANVTAENIQSALGYTPVKDVQVAGSSVLDGGVANVPTASETKEGVIKAPFAAFGLQLNNDNRPYVSAASEADITARQTFYRPLVPARIDYAVKAAMCDGKGAAWTSAEQKASRERMGVDKAYELIEEVTIDEEGVSVVERNVDLTRMYLMIIGESGHTGTCSVSTAFDTGHSFSAYWNLANIAAQYELNVEHGIANGFYKFSNSGSSSTPTISGINLNAMSTIFSATVKPSKISKLTISGAIPNGSKFIIYGVRA